MMTRTGIMMKCLTGNGPADFCGMLSLINSVTCIVRHNINLVSVTSIGPCMAALSSFCCAGNVITCCSILYGMQGQCNLDYWSALEAST